MSVYIDIYSICTEYTVRYINGGNIMSSSYALEVKHVTKNLIPNKNRKDDKRHFVLENMRFAIEPGYVLGIVGANGAGKTTLINTILGIYKPDAGKIYVNGYDRVTEGVMAKKSIAFVTDECLFPLDLTPLNIGKMFGPLYDKFDLEKYIGYLNRFNIPMKKSLRKQSKGMVVKVQLAFCLSYKAVLYIFDEPSAGLDPIFRKELLELFFEIVSDGTKSIILSTHLTEDLDKIADYILYLDKGRQKFFMDKEELTSKYSLIKGSKGQINYYNKYIIGRKDTDYYSEALIEKPVEMSVPVEVCVPTIEDIMVYHMTNQKVRGDRLC